MIPILIIGLFTVFLTSCGLNSSSDENNVVKECNVPTDQSGTISGRWQAVPIPVAFYQGNFSTEELTAMAEAATTWNTFFTASKSLNTLDFGGDTANPRASTVNNTTGAAGLCTQAIIQGTSFTGNVVVYKRTKWPSSYSASAIALTNYCIRTGTSYMYTAIVEINYQNYFVSGGKQPDLKSILIHEWGHLHGLGHSCEAAGGKGIPSCNDPNLNADYSTAVMFPVFGFDPTTGAGEQKRTLGTNDQSRANCLYP